ncbi:MAG: Ig-like domain-containing protein [Hyphomicrobiaceae bacterium]
MATRRGTSARDIIRGDLGADVIYGLSGNDDLYGNGANDTLKGGTGNDHLFGGDGNDKMYGEAGVDSLTGDAGNDTLKGGLGNDRILGGKGIDTLYGEGGSDLLDGGSGADTAVFSGVWRDYSIALAGSTYTVTDNRAGSPDGVDTVTAVETFKFASGSFAAAQILNDGPVATGDSGFAASEDTDLIVRSADVLANDTDADTALGDTLSVISVQDSVNGTVALSNGNIMFTPDANFNGQASFTYTIADHAGLTSTATVTFTVAAVNDAPVAGDDVASGDEDTPITTGNVFDNDQDVDSSASITGFTDGAHGSVADNGNGTFTYTPNADFVGTDTFTYTIGDDSLSDTATVTVTVNNVNDAPVAGDDAYSGDEDTAITTGNIFDNDLDIDSSASLASFTQGAHGAVVSNGNGTFTYTPVANYFGSDTFTYTITDGALSDTATVTMTVNPVNDAPVAVDDVFTTSMNTPLNIWLKGLVSNDTDIDSASLLPAWFQGAIDNGVFDYQFGTLTFTPSTNFVGTTGFDYMVSDGDLLDTGHVTINVV